jgi:lipoteichoic acid synthase
MNNLKTTFGNILVFSVCILILGAAPYFIFLNSIESFFDTVSLWERIKGMIHIALHSLLFPALVILISMTLKTRILLTSIHLIFMLTLLANSVYYSYFGSLIHLSLLPQASVLNDVSGQIFSQLITIKEILLFLPISFSLAYSIWFSAPHRPQVEKTASRLFKIALLIIILLLIIKPLFLGLRHGILKVRKHNELHMAKQFGFIPFYLSEAFLIVSRRNSQIPDFPGRINPVPSSRKPDAKRTQYNVIFLQVESLDAKALTLKIGGKELTPNLNALKDQMVYFPHFFAQHRGGASQDSELSALYSILPVNGRSGFNSLKMSETSSLLATLKEKGYHTLAFHANIGNFFNRDRLLRKSGFDEFFEKESFTGNAKGWNSKDIDFFNQSLAKLEKFKEPFFAYFITMQSHGPYQNYGKFSDGLDTSIYNELQADYFRSIHEVDHAIGHFFRSLKSKGLLDHTILFLFSDHASGVDYPAKSYPLPSTVKEHIPLFIYHPELPPSSNNKTGSQLDLAPTLTELLKLPSSATWLGSSLFLESRSRVILNYPKPIIYEFLDGKFSQGSDLEFSNPFIRWSEALQNY